MQFKAKFLGLALALLAPATSSVAKTVFGSVPEAERGLRACIMGLDPADGKYFGLPEFPATLAKRYGWDRQLFWLNLELSHGTLLKQLPLEARIFVACPQIQGKADWRDARRFFLDYLGKRAAWSAARRETQLRFFKVRDPLIWAQDFSFQVGTGPKGERLLHTGPEDSSVYVKFTDDLVRQHPATFSKRTLPKGISGEGGDLALARAPDGSVQLFLGRHRVKHYFEAQGWDWDPSRPMREALLAEVEAAYSEAYGVPARVCPRAPLLQAWGSDELFHLDMLTSFMGGSPSQVVVPDMLDNALDRFDNSPLNPTQRKIWQKEYDAVADELKTLGYKVRRAPLGDHPARSPTNSIKYRSTLNGEKVVLLSRYADAASRGGTCAIRSALERLADLGEALPKIPDRRQVEEVDTAIRDLWAAIDECANDADATFDDQAAAYAKTGFRVVAVPNFPWGAGSLHCQFLH